VPTLSSLSSRTADSIASALSIVDPPYVKPKKGKKPTTLQKLEAAAYPISTFTYAIIPHDAPQKGFLQQFVNYAITKGQTYGPALDFAPLPKVVLSAAKAAAASL